MALRPGAARKGPGARRQRGDDPACL